jgi:hypothetical protein
MARLHIEKPEHADDHLRCRGLGQLFAAIVDAIACAIYRLQDGAEPGADVSHTPFWGTRLRRTTRGWSSDIQRREQVPCPLTTENVRLDKEAAFAFESDLARVERAAAISTC